MRQSVLKIFFEAIFVVVSFPQIFMRPVPGLWLFKSPSNTCQSWVLDGRFFFLEWNHLLSAMLNANSMQCKSFWASCRLALPYRPPPPPPTHTHPRHVGDPDLEYVQYIYYQTTYSTVAHSQLVGSNRLVLMYSLGLSYCIVPLFVYVPYTGM